MARNYWKTPPSTKIGKTNFPSKNTAMRWYRYPIHFVKNDPVNIVISASYRLLTCANRTTARRFWFRQSATKWVETLRPKWTFWRFPVFKRGIDSVFSPIPSMQCCATVRATFRKQETSQLWMEGTGEGCGFLCFRSYPIWYNVSTILSPIVASPVQEDPSAECRFSRRSSSTKLALDGHHRCRSPRKNGSTRST